MSELGAKHDQGKLLFGCFTKGLAPVIKGVVAVLTYGAMKYKRDSWKQVPNARERYMDAFDRHMSDYNLGIKRDYGDGKDDKGSNLPVLFHAICDLMFVAWFEINENFVKEDIYTFNKPENKNE